MGVGVLLLGAPPPFDVNWPDAAPVCRSNGSWCTCSNSLAGVVPTSADGSGDTLGANATAAAAALAAADACFAACMAASAANSGSTTGAILLCVDSSNRAAC